MTINEIVINGELWAVKYESSQRTKGSSWYVNTKERKIGIINIDQYDDTNQWLIKRYVEEARRQ